MEFGHRTSQATGDGGFRRWAITDGFVSGDFTPAGKVWSGLLRWGDGETWNGVGLSPAENCREGRTNQSWWFKRETALRGQRFLFTQPTSRSPPKPVLAGRRHLTGGST